MHIQKASASDIEKIMPVVQNAVKFMNSNGNFQWDASYPTQKVFEKDIEAGHLFIAKDLLKIAGFVVLNYEQPKEYLTMDWKTPKNALIIHRMAVAPEYRGQGIARNLFEFAEKEAINQNLKTIRSDTNKTNKAMNHLFKAFNYRFTGEIVLRNNPDLFNCYEKAL